VRAPRFVLAALFAAPAACVIDELDDYDVGDAPLCEAASPWPSEYGDLEDDLLARIQTVRRQGRTCGDVRLNPAAAPTVAPELRCAARVHATFIAENGGVGHDGYDDTTPLSRAALAGYRGSLRYELVARDFVGPGATLGAWLEDEGHCSALLSRAVVDIGIGHSRTGEGDATGWVVLLGEPRDD